MIRKSDQKRKSMSLYTSRRLLCTRDVGNLLLCLARPLGAHSRVCTDFEAARMVFTHGCTVWGKTTASDDALRQPNDSPSGFLVTQEEKFPAADDGFNKQVPYEASLDTEAVWGDR